MVVGKNVNIKGKWQWIELSDKEIDQAIEKTEKLNEKILEKIFKNIAEYRGVTPNPQYPPWISLVPNIFDKMAISSFTVMNHILNKKIVKMREKERKEKEKKVKEYEKEKGKKVDDMVEENIGDKK